MYIATHSNKFPHTSTHLYTASISTSNSLNNSYSLNNSMSTGYGTRKVVLDIEKREKIDLVKDARPRCVVYLGIVYIVCSVCIICCVLSKGVIYNVLYVIVYFYF